MASDYAAQIVRLPAQPAEPDPERNEPSSVKMDDLDNPTWEEVYAFLTANASKYDDPSMMELRDRLAQLTVNAKR
jgi:hypothetical protein